MLKVTKLERLRHIGHELLDISLQVGNGEAVAILGPNGGGKSALLWAIASPKNNTGGSVTINHFDAAAEAQKARLHLGYLTNPVEIESYLTGFEYLHLIGSLYNLAPSRRTERILQLANLFGCTQYLYTLLEQLGPALHQKVALMAALLHQPQVLLLDEPTLNLDPEATAQVTTYLTDFVRKGGALLLATNNLELAEGLADRIIIFDHGQMVAEGTLAQLHHQTRGSKDLSSIYADVLGS